MVQKVLLVIHGVAWLAAVVLTAWRTGSVPAELWTVLPLGVSAILVAFRAGDENNLLHRHPPNREDPK